MKFCNLTNSYDVLLWWFLDGHVLFSLHVFFFSDEQCYETDLKPHFVFTYLVTRAAKDIIHKSRVEVSLVEQDTIGCVSLVY